MGICTGYRDAANPLMNASNEEANKTLALWYLRLQDAFGVRFICGSNNRTSCIHASSSQSRAKSQIKYIQIQIRVVKTYNSCKYYTLFTNIFLHLLDSCAWFQCKSLTDLESLLFAGNENYNNGILGFIQEIQAFFCVKPYEKAHFQTESPFKLYLTRVIFCPSI